MAYDPADGYVVMFGGNSGTYLQDTWVYKSGFWTELFPTTAPAARDHSTLAWDPVDGYLVLFGGYGLSGAFSDTWTFLHGNWTLLSPLQHPSARWAAAMTWDAAGSRILLFGGCVGGFAANDTWSFLGGNWTLLHPANSPPARENAAIEFDPVDNETLLFGGDNYYTALYGDTWVFAAGNWVQVQPSGSPTPRTEASMAYFPGIDSVVLFGGGYQGLPTGETWWFSHGIWTKQTPRDSPPARNFGMMAYLPSASELVLFSGRGAGYLNDTWIYYELALNATVTPLSGVSPLAVSYQASVVNARGAPQFDWSFGDGNSSASPLAQETLTSPGVYTAAVRVIDSNGSAVGASTLVHVLPPMTAVVVVSPSSGWYPLSVGCSALATGGVPPYSYLWSSGSGNTSLAAATTFVYQYAGTYQISVTIHDSAGEFHNQSFAVNVTTPATVPALTVSVTASLSRGPAPLAVTFAGNVTGGAGPYRTTWTFGDASSGSGFVVTHSFDAAGTFTPTLSATDARGTVRSASVQVVVTPGLWLEASASPSPTKVGQAVLFAGSVGGGAPPYLGAWTFGDGSGSADLNASHSYAAAGAYNATLTVVDGRGVTLSREVALEVSPAAGPPTSPNLLSQLANSIPAVVAITALVTGAAVAAAFRWMRRRERQQP
ncbi:MAG TPA: PKD domain-containing protein [Thermoplasmata archaeon]|nr:PKD domain-containing protein [Thermoplasmata archaeon]